MKLTEAHVREALAIMGIDWEAVGRSILGVEGQAVAEERLAEWKSTLRRAYRQAIVRWHPDKPDGCAEKTKLLVAVYSELKNAKIIRRRPRPQPPVFRGTWMTYASTSDTTTTASDGTAWVRVNVRHG